MIRPNRVDRPPIIYIMLNRNLNPYPTVPPTLFFSINEIFRTQCPPIF